jgi:hypothetical protein
VEDSLVPEDKGMKDSLLPEEKCVEDSLLAKDKGCMEDGQLYLRIRLWRKACYT